MRDRGKGRPWGCGSWAMALLWGLVGCAVEEYRGPSAGAGRAAPETAGGAAEETGPGLEPAAVTAAGALEFAGPSRDGCALAVAGGYVDGDQCLGVANTFTIELWVQPTATHEIDPEATGGASGTVGQRYAIWPTHGWCWCGGTLCAGVGLSVGTNGISVYEHSDGYMPPVLVWQGCLRGWNHIAIVYSGGTPALYLNGAFVRTGRRSGLAVYPSNGHGAAYPGQWGGVGAGSYGNFAGSVDDFRIWNHARSAVQIAANYNLRLSTPQSGLIVYYPLDECSGTTAYDASGHGPNGAVRPGATWASSNMPKPVGCDDGRVCTDDTCDSGAGCQHTFNTAPCNDADACTRDDTCANGVCIGGPRPDCNDGNPCTDDSCDSAEGCLHAFNTDPCNDGNACTLDDRCTDGECAGGPPLDCNDGNPCTDDSCASAEGCVRTPGNEGEACGAGAPCQPAPLCRSGACTAQPPLPRSGDVSGDGVISAGDAQLAFLIALAAFQPSAAEACAADCDGDGSVSSGDAQSIFFRALGSGSGCLDRGAP